MILGTAYLWHTVFIAFKKETSDDARKDIGARFQTLQADCGGEEAGILYFQVCENLDQRKGIHLVEQALFSDKEALERFRVHPKHKELTDALREVADWWVGDAVLPLPVARPLRVKDLDLMYFDPQN